MSVPADRLAEEHDTLWLLAASPAIWAVHLLASYATAAIWCGKLAGPFAPLSSARIAIAAYTIAALVGIAVIGVAGLRRHRLDREPPPHDADTPEDRHRFIGYSTFLLSALSAVAVLYAALAIIFVEGCQ